MVVGTSLLRESQLEEAGQSLAGIIGGYAVAKFVEKITTHNTYDGVMNFQQRGIHERFISEGDHFIVDGLISPFTLKDYRIAQTHYQ